jgi:hypothetical protein
MSKYVEIQISKPSMYIGTYVHKDSLFVTISVN